MAEIKTLANKVRGKLKGSCTDPVEIVNVGPDLCLSLMLAGIDFVVDRQ